MSGILTISASHNGNFSRLLSYHNITAGNIWNVPGNPGWGIGNKNYSYYACENYPDQINLYRLHRSVIIGGLNLKALTYGDICDNTKTLTMPYKYHSDRPWEIPASYADEDLETYIYWAVTNYLNDNEHCSIMYSGGVDSACIVAAFMKYANIGEYTVAYTKESIEEYPLFFDYMVKNKVPMVDLEQADLSDLPGIVIQGLAGDVLLPSVNGFSSRGILESSWQEAFDKDEWGDDYEPLIEFTSNYLKLSGYTDPTVAQLCLFTDLVTNYNYSMSHLHYDTNLSSTKLSSFFRSHWFERWAYNHAPKYMVNSHMSHGYRIPMKKCIYGLLRDEDYVRNKGKGDSRHLWTLKCSEPGNTADKSQYFFIDYHGERISAATYDEYRTKYGDRFDSYFTINT